MFLLAKEASKRIVDDILTTAGLDYDDEEIDFSQELETQGFDMDENSPSVVRKADQHRRRDILMKRYPRYSEMADPHNL